MRKLLTLTFMALLTMPIQARDGDQVTLQAGTANVIWTLSSAYFDTDFSVAKVEGIVWNQWLQSKGNDFVRDWPSDKQKVDNYFMERFNKKTKKKRGLNLQNTNPNDAYRFVIHFNDIDMGSIGGGVVASVFLGGFGRKSGGVNLKSGYVDIYEAATGKVVCRLSFKDVKGDSGMSMSAQLLLVFEDLHDELIGFAERFSSKQMPETTVATVSTAIPVQQNVTTVATVPQSVPAMTPTQQAPIQFSQQSSAQQVTVTLKTGVTITGEMKSFDPMTKIVLLIAGKETTILMSKVSNVETAQDQPTIAVSQPVVNPQPATVTPIPVPVSNGTSLGNRKILVTESTNYPQHISINIGQTPVEMVLVNGGHMNMGYDGDGSLRMNSEPVHEVVVTSFYISKHPLPASIITQIVGTKNVDGNGNQPAQVRIFDDAQRAVTTLANQTGLRLRMPTEAEWEYAACSDQQHEIFSIAGGRDIAYEWCSDFLDDYPESGLVVTDPIGPSRGKEHVVRSYNGKRGKFDRSNKIDEDDAYLGLVRLVIKASNIK